MSAAHSRADGPTLNVSDLDRMALDTLKEVHNRGAQLYNAGDSAACFRVYQGALIAVRPYLAHRPNILAHVDSGLADVEKSLGVKIQAFRLHEVIDQVRSDLKAELKRADAGGRGPTTDKIDVPSPKLPTAATPTLNPMPSPRVPPPEPVRPAPAPAPAPQKPTAEALPAPKADPGPPSIVDLAPLPKTPAKSGVKPLAIPLPGAAPAVAPRGGGRVTLNGQPLERGEVGFICTDVQPARLITGEIKGGRYVLDEEPPAGDYRVTVMGSGVPKGYANAGTSGLTVKVAAGKPVAFDIELVK